jgi:signal transduction histidine kinase
MSNTTFNTEEFLIFLLSVTSLGGLILLLLLISIILRHQKDELLTHCRYFLLLVTLFFSTRLLAKFIIFNGEDTHLYENFWFSLFNEPIQILIYVFYINFSSLTLNLSNEKYPILCKCRHYTYILCSMYIIFHLIGISSGKIEDIYVLFAYSLRLILLGLIATLTFYFYKEGIYSWYLWLGMLSFAGGLVLSCVIKMTPISLFRGVTSIDCIIVGSFLNSLFFAAAAVYRLQNRLHEKAEANYQSELKHQQELYQNKLNHQVALFDIRHRISRKLHDDIAATINHISRQIEKLEKLMPPNQAISEVALRIHRAASLAKCEFRQLIWILKTGGQSYEKEGLSQFLCELGEDRLPNPTFDIDEKVPFLAFNMNAKANILSICKTAFDNICKHSQTKNCFIQILVEKDALCLKIVDYGIGTTVTPETTRNNGLRNMQEYVGALGGHFEMQSVDNQGTTLYFTLPLANIMESPLN